MERDNQKAQRYNEILAEHDALDYKISKLRATNGGINLSEQIEKEIYDLQLKKEKLEIEYKKMFG